MIVFEFKWVLSRRFSCILVETAEIFDKEPVFNMKSFIEPQEENIKGFLKGEFLAISPKYTGRT